MTDASALRVDSYWSSAHDARVVISGEIDMHTVPTLAATVDEVCQKLPARLLIDITDVDFCDSSGLWQFARCSRICDDQGTNIRIVGAQPIVRRLFEIVGIDHLLMIDG